MAETQRMPNQCSHRGPFAAAPALLLAAVLGGVLVTGRPAAAQPNVPPDFDPVALGLDPVPLLADALGLAFHPPAATAVSTARDRGRLTWILTDRRAEPAWSIRIHGITSSLPDPSAGAEVDRYLRQLEGSRTRFRVISNETVTCGSVAGRLCYLEQEVPGGGPVITGWLVLPSGPRTFVVFSIRTSPEHLPRLQDVLDASFATISLRTAEELAGLRQTRLEAGRALIESLTAPRLAPLVGLSQWFRIYRPGEGGTERELGYSRIEVVAAKKGTLNPQRREREYDAGEHAMGLQIRVQGRIAIDPSRGVYYDSIALYWMAWDQSEEAWSIRGTHRQGKATRSESETGIRPPASAGAPRPKLTVIKSSSASFSRDPYEWTIPEVYLSQALGWVIGHLLPKDDPQPREYGYYFYNYANAEPKVSLRVDRWAPADDGTGNWVLTARLSADSAPARSVYRPDGRLLIRERDDGTVTVPIDRQQLRRLWQRKGLVLGGSR